MGDMDNTVKTLQQALRVDQENKEIRVMLKSVKSMVETKEQGLFVCTSVLYLSVAQNHCVTQCICMW